MQKKKSAKSKTGPLTQAQHDDAPLFGVAHTIGSTLGAAAVKAGDAAKEIGTIAQDVGRTALAATRRIYKSAQKGLRRRATSGHAGARKLKPPKRASGRSTRRGK
jgi:hypothetical protein